MWKNIADLKNAPSYIVCTIQSKSQFFDCRGKNIEFWDCM